VWANTCRVHFSAPAVPGGTCYALYRRSECGDSFFRLFLLTNHVSLHVSLVFHCTTTV